MKGDFMLRWGFFLGLQGGIYLSTKGPFLLSDIEKEMFWVEMGVLE